MDAVTLEQWKERVRALYPAAQFTLEDGSGKTYGEEGSWTAHTGPDMQSDVVATCSPDDEFANIYLVGGDVLEFVLVAEP